MGMKIPHWIHPYWRMVKLRGGCQNLVQFEAIMSGHVCNCRQSRSNRSKLTRTVKMTLRIGKIDLIHACYIMYMLCIHILKDM